MRDLLLRLANLGIAALTIVIIVFDVISIYQYIEAMINYGSSIGSGLPYMIINVVFNAVYVLFLIFISLSLIVKTIKNTYYNSISNAYIGFLILLIWIVNFIHVMIQINGFQMGIPVREWIMMSIVVLAIIIFIIGSHVKGSIELFGIEASYSNIFRIIFAGLGFIFMIFIFIGGGFTEGNNIFYNISSTLIFVGIAGYYAVDILFPLDE